MSTSVYVPNMLISMLLFWHVAVHQYPPVAFIAVSMEAKKVDMAEPGHHLQFSCEITFAFPCDSRLPKPLQTIFSHQIMALVTDYNFLIYFIILYILKEITKLQETRSWSINISHTQYWGWNIGVRTSWQTKLPHKACRQSMATVAESSLRKTPQRHTPTLGCTGWCCVSVIVLLTKHIPRSQQLKSMYCSSE